MEWLLAVLTVLEELSVRSRGADANAKRLLEADVDDHDDDDDV